MAVVNSGDYVVEDFEVVELSEKGLAFIAALEAGIEMPVFLQFWELYQARLAEQAERVLDEQTQAKGYKRHDYGKYLQAVMYTLVGFTAGLIFDIALTIIR